MNTQRRLEIEDFGGALAEVLNRMGLWDRTSRLSLRHRGAIPTSPGESIYDESDEDEDYSYDDDLSTDSPIDLESDEGNDVMARARIAMSDREIASERFEWERFWQVCGIDDVPDLETDDESEDEDWTSDEEEEDSDDLQSEEDEGDCYIGDEGSDEECGRFLA